MFPSHYFPARYFPGHYFPHNPTTVQGQIKVTIRAAANTAIQLAEAGLNELFITIIGSSVTIEPVGTAQLAIKTITIQAVEVNAMDV